MPHADSNIPSCIFYGSIFSEILRIARSTLMFEDLTPRVHELFSRMRKQGACDTFLKRQVIKCFQRFPVCFSRYGKTLEEFLSVFEL